MKAEILSVGTELLLGEIVNTNSAYLARELADLGIDVYYQTVVGDNENRIVEAFKNAYQRADLVITTGGMGPTEDDMTREMGGRYFEVPMELDEAALEQVKEFFQKTNRNMPSGNIKQATFPKGSIILKNLRGTAPGAYFEKEGKILIMLPGPPHEMEDMWLKEAKPLLKKKSSDMLKSKVIRIIGIGESSVEEQIKEELTSKNPTLGIYAGNSQIRLRITAKGSNEEADKLIEKMELNLKEKFGSAIYGYDEDSLEGVVADILKKKGLKIAVAESLTGGLVSSMLVNVAGISENFMEGVVSYSIDSKMKRLGVLEDTIKTHTEVSSQAAMEMAKGVALNLGTDIGISTTGISGPDGGTKDRPVGLCYIGVYYKGQVTANEVRLFGQRDQIRQRAAITALNILRLKLIGQK